MPIIPQELQAIAPILTLFLDPLQKWFSQWLYKHLISKNEKHILVKLNNLLEFKQLEKACANYHHQQGRGRKISHGVNKLIRIIIVKALYNYSLRQTEEQVRNNLVVRWFVGYGLWEAVADHNSIHAFEKYLYTTQTSMMADEMLKQIDHLLPKNRAQIQMADTFATLADAALESLIKRLRHSCANLLMILEKRNQEKYAEVIERLDGEALFGTEKEKLEFLLTTEEREARLLATVQGTSQCIALTKEETDEDVQVWLDHLGKILTDELALTYKGEAIIAVRLLDKKERGTYRICSATDPDATIRNHGPKKVDFGYNTSVLTNKNFIRNIQVDTGSQPDPIALPQMLASQLEHHGLAPHKVLYDQIAGTGKCAMEVTQATHNQTQLVAKPMPYPERDGRFGPADFTLNEGQSSLTCPNDVTTIRRYWHKGHGHWFFRFPAKLCAGCPLWEQCRDPKASPTAHRDVHTTPQQAYYARLVAYSKTDDFKQEIKQRPQVERVIAGLVRYNGARRARYRGLHKVDFQMKMCAMAYNLKRLVKILADPAHAYALGYCPQEGNLGRSGSDG